MARSAIGTPRPDASSVSSPSSTHPSIPWRSHPTVRDSSWARSRVVGCPLECCRAPADPQSPSEGRAGPCPTCRLCAGRQDGGLRTAGMGRRHGPGAGRFPRSGLAEQPQGELLPDLLLVRRSPGIHLGGGRRAVLGRGHGSGSPMGRPGQAHPGSRRPVSRRSLRGHRRLVARFQKDESAPPIDVWEMASGQKVANLFGHAGSTNGLCFSPDGRWLVSCSGDRRTGLDATVRIWDVATGGEAAPVQRS